MRYRAALAAMAWMMIAPAAAGELADRALAAEGALEAGDARAAITEFEKAQEALWAAMPLTILDVAQVANAAGVGIYSERANSIYAPGEKLLLYVQPVGYSYGDDGLGNKVIALAVDLTEIGGRRGAWHDREYRLDQAVVADTQSRVFFSLNLSLDAASIPAGKYTAEFLMRDLNSQKTAPFAIDFEIAG